MSHLQMLGVLGIFKARGTQIFNEVTSRPSDVIGGSFLSVLPVKCALGSQIYGPFLLNMLLPPVALATSALMMVPTHLLEQCARKRRVKRDTPVFKGKFFLPRILAPLAMMRESMTAADVEEWNGVFLPKKRIAGVAVFMLFVLYVSRECALLVRYHYWRITHVHFPRSHRLVCSHNLQLPLLGQVYRADIQLHREC